MPRKRVVSSVSKKDFTITLFSDNMESIENHAKYALPECKDILFFHFERQPNIETGQVFSVRVIIDEKSIVKFDAEVLDIVPPLLQPAEEEKFEMHAVPLRKYIQTAVIDQIKKDYFSGEAQRNAWTVYFKKTK